MNFDEPFFQTAEGTMVLVLLVCYIFITVLIWLRWVGQNLALGVDELGFLMPPWVREDSCLCLQGLFLAGLLLFFALWPVVLALALVGGLLLPAVWALEYLRHRFCVRSEPGSTLDFWASWRGTRGRKSTELTCAEEGMMAQAPDACVPLEVGRSMIPMQIRVPQVQVVECVPCKRGCHGMAHAHSPPSTCSLDSTAVPSPTSRTTIQEVERPPAYTPWG
jgi:hypothetical protein